jgi:hypothetical protein
VAQELFSDLGRETRGELVGLWVRRCVMTLCVVIVVAALLDVFGQRSTTSVAAGPAVTLRLDAPDTVRGGLFFQAKLDVQVHRTIQFPRFVFDRGWLAGLQVNSIEPAAQSESSRDGRLVLSYDQLSPGDRVVLYFQFQVNPTHVGREPFGVELDERTTRLARIDRHLTSLP